MVKLSHFSDALPFDSGKLFKIYNQRILNSSQQYEFISEAPNQFPEAQLGEPWSSPGFAGPKMVRFANNKIFGRFFGLFEILGNLVIFAHYNGQVPQKFPAFLEKLAKKL